MALVGMRRGTLALLAAALALPFGGGCAEIAAAITGEMAGACLEITARAACATLCDDDDEEEPLEDVEEPKPTRPAEPPPPDWRPAVADCELKRDEVGVHVDCAGGTRALFVAAAELATDAPIEARTPTVHGPVEIRAPLDIGRLAGTRAIEGSLVIRSRELVSLVAPELRSIGGDLTITHASALSTLALPALASVGGAVVIADNPSLPQKDAEEIVFRLTRHGFAGVVDVAGNAPPSP